MNTTAPCRICSELLDLFVSAVAQEREAERALADLAEDAERVWAVRILLKARRDTEKARENLVDHYTMANAAQPIEA